MSRNSVAMGDTRSSLMKEARGTCLDEPRKRPEPKPAKSQKKQAKE